MVQKQDYLFPSEIQKGSIGNKHNIYNGGSIKIKKNNQPLRLSIPMDPKEKPSNVAVKKLTSRLATTIAGINPLIPAFIIIYMSALWLRPPWTEQVLLFNAINLIILIYQIYIRVKNRTKLGKVVDKNGKSVPEVELGLFDKEYDELVTETKSGKNGRFLFIVPGKEYNLKVLDTEYTLVDQKHSESIPVGRDTVENIEINPTVRVRRTSKTDL
jgi:hypothetical protein